MQYKVSVGYSPRIEVETDSVSVAESAAHRLAKQHREWAVVSVEGSRAVYKVYPGGVVGAWV